MLIVIHDVIHGIWDTNPLACIRFAFHGYLKFSITQHVYAVFCLLSDFILLIFYVIALYLGFNAAVAGCFFAVESVLWPSADSSSLANSTPMVILSSVIASVVSEIGLGSDPAFTVPEYDFRSPTGTL